MGPRKDTGPCRASFSGRPALATVWSLLHAVPAFQDAGWLMILNVFWPLSMLGMLVIGVKILFTGRWTGLARVWPTVAEIWAVDGSCRDPV